MRLPRAPLLVLVLGGATCALALPFVFRAEVVWADLAPLLLVGTVALSLAVVVHGGLTTSWSRSLAFFAVAVAAGWGAEAAGLQSTFPFGARYRYHPDLAPLLPGGVPLFIPLAWHALAGAPLVLLRRLHVRVADRLRLGRWALKTLLASLFLAATDVFLDPLAVSVDAWTWIGGGAWFETPLSNAAGWLGVGVVVYGVTLPWSEPTTGPTATRRPDVAFGLIALVLTVLGFVAVLVHVGSVLPILAACVVLVPVWTVALRARFADSRT